MLAREQRRRHDHRDLTPGQRDGEGGAQRHLRLAEADVAADQPVHGPADRKVVQHRVDSGLLVVGLVIGKRAQNSS